MRERPDESRSRLDAYDVSPERCHVSRDGQMVWQTGVCRHDAPGDDVTAVAEVGDVDWPDTL